MEEAPETLSLVRDVGRALGGGGSLSERLATTHELLSAALAARCLILRGEESEPEPDPAARSLELPIEAEGARLGTLRLERPQSGAGWGEVDRLAAEVIASQIGAAILGERRLRVATMNEDFLATLSHELRTPLNVVVGWVDMLRSGRLDPDKQRRALDLIDRNSRIQVRLVEDLLDASRLVSGRLQLDRSEVRVAEVVTALIDSLEPLAEEMDISLTAEADPRLRVSADPERLGQMIQNLVGNALKFSAPGARVTVEAREEGGRAAITVTDTGAGIAAELLPRLFDRFWQGERKRLAKSRGLGLGLFITRNLAELHGGEIAAFSEGPGKGARFTFWLPLI